MIERFQSFFGHQFIRFLLVGVINTAVGYAAFLIAWKWLQTDFKTSNLISYVIGVSVSFVLTKSYVFYSHRFSLNAAVRFFLAFIVAYSLNMAMLVLLIAMGLRPELAQLGAMGVYTVSFYALNKIVVWR